MKGYIPILGRYTEGPWLLGLDIPNEGAADG